MIRTRIRRTATAAATLALLASPAAAQFGPGLDAAGVAGAYMGLARSQQAIYWNPANLALGDGDRWSLGLPQLVATGASLGPALGDFGTLLSDDLSDAERAGFLADVPDGGLGFRGNIELPVVGVGVGNFAIGFSTTLLADANLGRELVDLYLYTRQYGDIDYDRITEYRVGNTTFTEARYSSLIAGYARSLGPVTVGASIRIVSGHEIQRGRLFEPRIDIVNSDFEVPVLAALSPGGSGYGLDVGAAMQPIPGLTVSLAIQNLLQKMTWDDAIEIRGDNFTGSDLADTGPTELQDRLQPRPYDPDAASLEAFTVVSDLFDESYFPRVIRGGAAFRIGSTALNGTFSATQGKGDLHAGWPHYIAVGVAQDFPVIPFLTLRAGLASSLSGASALTGGASFNLGPAHLTAAVGRINGADDIDDTTGGYRYAERLAEASGYFFGLGMEVSGR